MSFVLALLPGQPFPIRPKFCAIGPFRSGALGMLVPQGVQVVSEVAGAVPGLAGAIDTLWAVARVQKALDMVKKYTNDHQTTIQPRGPIGQTKLGDVRFVS